MIKKQLVILGIIALFLCVCFSGCEGFHSLDFLKSDTEKLYGIWETEYRIPHDLRSRYYINYSAGYQIYGNGKIRNFNGYTGTWELKDGKLIIVYNDS